MPEQLYNDPDLVQFYDIENGWAADMDYCRSLAANARSVLDLGCGTGLLAATLGSGRRVAGVDPARAMLDVARGRNGGDAVTWVEADARTVRLGETFDLIVLTGHAFQVFLTEAYQLAVLKTIYAHLSAGGRFVFDSRNPVRAEWREWTRDLTWRELQHPSLGVVEAWCDTEQDPQTGVVTYHSTYLVQQSGATFTAPSRLRFSSQRAIAALVEQAGLTVDRWLGDWQGAPFESGSGEIIPVGRLTGGSQ